jgi:NitT/TauT family transport system substrate-binding protein
MSSSQSRRRVLSTLALAGVAGLIRAPRVLASEAALETTTVRLQTPGLCVPPLYIAEELLRADGFTDIRYIDAAGATSWTTPVARGAVDFAAIYCSDALRVMDTGSPMTLLAGVMVGCFELFARAGIDTIAGLRGKSVGVQQAGSLAQALVTLMAAQVGLDPAKDIHWVTHPSVKPIELFTEGKIDAFLGFPPEPQQLRARHFGRSLVNTAVDRPWSQYFCCMLAGNPNFVRAYPVATKRVLAAILKATDLCATEPARAARQLVDEGRGVQYDFAFQTLSENGYNKWREYDPEDTIRWYALRLHEVDLIKSSPQKILAENTNWRFLDELKRELKA